MGIRAFQSHILRWYKKYGRTDLPWRKTKNPYHILISEVMLQQTQVGRVIPKYRRFIRTFPTLQSLARARTPALLRIWQGLGYNRRALFLREAARRILDHHRGVFPRDISVLESLPGIGPYTARAIAAFSWNQPYIFLETNIRRVYIHYFFKNKKKISDTQILPRIAKTLYNKNPRLWYGALMDYGAMLGSTLKRTQGDNPNQKSTSHRKQTRFIGSQRYARAHLLHFLLHKRKVNEREIFKFMGREAHLSQYRARTPHILASLAREGFIKKQGNAWKIAL